MGLRGGVGMRTTIVVSALMATLVASAPPPAVADVWDRSVPTDGSSSTRSELVHGSDELHDLAKKGSLPDEDWYRLSQQPYTSYEVLVEATAGEIAPPVLERLAADGTTVLQTAVGIGAIGFTRSLRWQNGAAPTDDQFVRVRSGSCVKCKKDAVYRIRAFETTYRVPRFNNTGTQVTVLVAQNPTDATIAGNVYFWNASGTLLATQPFTIQAKALLTLATQTVVPDVSGSATVSHDGRYGDLAGKALALEPSTGFSFDTPMEPRPK
jgi:hypothetical protein